MPTSTRPARTFPRIATPCARRWDQMTSVPGGRRCGHCAKDVFDLSEMTEPEALILLAQNSGSACVRYLGDAKGRPLFRPTTRAAALAAFATALSGTAAASSTATEAGPGFADALAELRDRVEQALGWEEAVAPAAVVVDEEELAAPQVDPALAAEDMPRLFLGGIPSTAEPELIVAPELQETADGGTAPR